MRRIALLTALVGALALGATASANNGKVYFKDFTHDPAIMPERIDIVYKKYDVFANDLKAWKHWGQARTKVRGHIHYNSCKPKCSDMHYTAVNGVVKLSGIRECGGQARYRKLEYDYNTDRPDLHVRIDCQGNAS